MNVTETTELLGLIADAFPGRVTVTKGMLTLWSRMLEDLSAKECGDALAEYLCSAVHPPAIGDIRSRVAIRRVGAPDVACAWEEVRRAVQLVGRYRVPTWSSAAVAGAVESLGWVELCNTLDSDLPTVRAQFERYFKARVETGHRAENFGALEAYADDRHGSLSAGEVVKSLLAERVK